jgi:phosphatidylinositol phospholipase C delta
VQSRGFLDFDDFKRFVKLLKARPEVKSLYEKFCSLDQGSFSFQTFEHFMRDYQKVSKRAIWHFKLFSYVQVKVERKRRRIEASLPPLRYTFARQRRTEGGPNPARLVSG